MSVVRLRPTGEREPLWAVVTGVLAFILTILRGPEGWNPIWAEDGRVFLSGAVYHGARSLFQFDAGNLNTIPWLRALAAASLPLSAAVFVMTRCAVAIASACGAAVEALSGAYIQSRWIRVGLGFCFGLPSRRFESRALRTWRTGSSTWWKHHFGYCRSSVRAEPVVL